MFVVEYYVESDKFGSRRVVELVEAAEWEVVRKRCAERKGLFAWVMSRSKLGYAKVWDGRAENCPEADTLGDFKISVRGGMMDRDKSARLVIDREGRRIFETSGALANVQFRNGEWVTVRLKPGASGEGVVQAVKDAAHLVRKMVDAWVEGTDREDVEDSIEEMHERLSEVDCYWSAEDWLRADWRDAKKIVGERIAGSDDEEEEMSVLRALAKEWAKEAKESGQLVDKRDLLGCIEKMRRELEQEQGDAEDGVGCPGL